ncbi:MAG: YHS domain-containing protein [Chloroflexota bacterium]
MTTDLVCGMTVNEGTSLQTAYKGKTYYFCSPLCKSLFERDPEKYIAEHAGPQNRTSAFGIYE